MRPAPAKRKIAVLTLSTPNIECYAVKSAANKEAYCRRHGYEFLNERLQVSDRPAAWEKIRLVKTAIRDFDWVLWTDADSIITNPAFKLDSLLDENFDLVVSADHNGINCGIFLIRRCDWSLSFLDEVWCQTDLIYHPWWEQAAIQRLYPIYSEHFKIVPQSALNCYDSNWRPGDFVLHLPATSSEYRTERLDVITDVVEQTMTDWLFTLRDRGELPNFLNRCGLIGHCVEVGVAAGDFAEHWLRNWGGQQLHLVDPWRHLPGYVDIANVGDSEHELRLSRVRERMSAYGERTMIHRGLSQEIVDQFSDDSLDCVYIDANHEHEAVYADLRYWYRKVKRGGILAGHDFLDGSLPEGEFGVKSAVEQFAREQQLHVYRSLEPKWPSFLLFKGDESSRASLGKTLQCQELLDDEYLLCRIGESRKRILFRSDGTVETRPTVERFWALDGHDLVLGGVNGEFCRLTRDAGGVYRGSRNGMEFELVPLRSRFQAIQLANLEAWAGEGIGWGEGVAVDLGEECKQWTDLLAIHYRSVVVSSAARRRTEAFHNPFPSNVIFRSIEEVRVDGLPGILELVKLDFVNAEAELWETLDQLIANRRPRLVLRFCDEQESHVRRELHRRGYGSVTTCNCKSEPDPKQIWLFASE